jgi:hypothetical protein
MRSALAASVRTVARATALARLATGLPAYARRPLTVTDAADAVERRLAAREQTFLSTLEQCVYSHAGSPYRRLLQWAGCAYGDLSAAVKRHGLEGALERLRDAGVHVSHAELSGTQPLRRGGHTLAGGPGDFDNPVRGAASLRGATSGSRSEGIRVVYTWDFLAEEVANELTLRAVHDVATAPLGYWMPALPALSGMHNALLDIGAGAPPLRWFSQVEPVARGTGAGRATRVLLRAAHAYVLWSARRAGAALASPEFTPLSEAHRVALWLDATRRAHGSVVLKAFTSSAVRVAAAARARDIDLRGAVLFTGGEPLSPRRRTFIESSGATALPRYVTTEAGLMAGACPARREADDMHVYLDRLAMVAGVPAGTDGAATLLVTSLSPYAGKILLNADLGDVGHLDTRACGCRFDALGYSLHLAQVRGYDKLTAEGMTVPTEELEAIVGGLVARAGGGPDDFQFWDDEDEAGLARLVIAIAPCVPAPASDGFGRAVLDELRLQHLRGILTAQVWEQAQLIRVVRQPPEVSPGQKLLRRIRIPERYASGFSATSTSR